MMVGVWATVVMDMLESYAQVCWTLLRHSPCYCSAFDSNRRAFGCHAFFAMSRLLGFCALSSESKDCVTRIFVTRRTLGAS